MIAVTFKFTCDQCGHSITLNNIDPLDTINSSLEVRDLVNDGWYINTETEDVLCIDCANKKREEL